VVDNGSSRHRLYRWTGSATYTRFALLTMPTTLFIPLY
jgi:hypothetical protein